MGLSRGLASHADSQGDGHGRSKEPNIYFRVWVKKAPMLCLGDIYFAVELSPLVFLYDLR